MGYLIRFLSLGAGIATFLPTLWWLAALPFLNSPTNGLQDFGSLLQFATIAFGATATLMLGVAATYTWKMTHAPRLRRAPGSLLLEVAEFVVSGRTFARVFEPVVADMQREYMEALRDGRMWKARWVRCRGTLTFITHAAAQLPTSSLRLATTMLGITR
jgi:hypothetical protein